MLIECHIKPAVSHARSFLHPIGAYCDETSRINHAFKFFNNDVGVLHQQRITAFASNDHNEQLKPRNGNISTYSCGFSTLHIQVEGSALWFLWPPGDFRIWEQYPTKPALTTLCAFGGPPVIIEQHPGETLLASMEESTEPYYIPPVPTFRD